MTSEKPGLRVIGPAKREPTPEMLRLAETVLERVKTGEVVALAVAAQYEDGGHSSSIALADGCRPVTLIGELAVLHGDLVRHEGELRRGGVAE